MLPDADHHSSSTAKVWGPVTSIPCGWFSKLVGGHRAGSHDISKGAPIFFAAVFGLGLLAPQVVPGTVGYLTGMAVVALIAGLCFVALAALIPGKWEGHGGSNLVMSWGTAWLVMHWYPAGLPWQVVLMAAGGIVVGVVTAIAQDGSTISGIPWRGRTIHLMPKGLRIRTGSQAERWFIRTPVLILVVIFTVQAAMWWIWYHSYPTP